MSKCKECETEVETVSDDDGTSYYLPVQRNLAEVVPQYDIPFWCSLCGSLKFPYQAVRDVVFLYADSVREVTDGGIVLPENLLAEMVNEYGTVLTVGPGYYDKNGIFHGTSLKPGDRVLYEKTVPWETKVKGSDGNTHRIKMMGERDVYCLVTEDCGVEK